MNRHRSAILCAFTATVAAGASAQTVTTDFSAGAQGWTGPSGPGGATAIVPEGGNGGAFLRTSFSDFGIEFTNRTNQAFIGDYTTAQQVTISMDLLVEDISGFNGPSSAPWLLELRNFDLAVNGLPWASVWFFFDHISAADNGGWSTFSVTFDPNSADLPAGWAGAGFDNDFAEPILPPGVSFSDVLSGVDQIAFTTLQPGFGFLQTGHTIGVDNLSITRVVPTPPAFALLGVGGLLAARRRR